MNKLNHNAVNTIYIVFIACCFCILGKVVYLQLFTDYARMAQEFAYIPEELEARRGDILSYDHKILASSVPYYRLRMDCVLPKDSVFEADVAALAQKLSAFFGDKNARTYEKEIREARAKGNRYKALGNRELEHYELPEVRNFPIFKLGTHVGGMITEQRNRRKYPYGRLGYRTIGFTNQNGVAVGIEGAYDFYLKGKPGEQILQRLLGAEAVPVSTFPTVSPQDGKDVVSTLDMGIQEAAENALRAQLTKDEVLEGGCCVVMETRTGAIRAIVNMKRMANGRLDESYNYAIAEATNPGSTFKLATLICLLEDNLCRLTDSVHTGNGIWPYATHKFRDVTHGGYGTLSLQGCFEKSSNVAFAKTAVEKYGDNEARFINRLYDMKLNERLDIELLGEGRARLGYPGEPGWSKLSLPMIAMGYELLLTPMHTLTFYNAVANNGRMVRPYFIERLEKNGQVDRVFTHDVLSNAICSPSTIKKVHTALRGVVTHGTAKAIFKDCPYEVSGKTGTAQLATNGVFVDRLGYRRHQASFAGFFPSQDPQYTAIVVLYSAKTRSNFYGASWAGPVFRAVSDYIYVNRPFDRRALPRPEGDPARLMAERATDTLSTRQALALRDTASVVPDVCGLTLPDALYLLENKDFEVAFQGSGKVVAQSPAAGTPLEKTRSLTLTLSPLKDEHK